jgi:glucose 1-dehydrogenase
MRLQNKVAIVTGAGSGNGRSIALRFAEEGADIVVADVVVDGAQATAAAVQALGRRALASQTDVSQREAVEVMVSGALAEFGRVDILVNNAGIGGRVKFLELTDEVWDRMMAINLKGPFLCAQAVARVMVQQGRGGKIINIGSIESSVPLPNQVHYATAKGGVLMLTRALALDLAAYGIRVNAIGPGIIETAMTAPTLARANRRQEWETAVPLGRVGQPLDVANAALFLASDESDYITGTILYVDGGWLIQ